MNTATPTTDDLRSYLARELYCPGIVDVTEWAETHYDGGIARLTANVAYHLATARTR